MDGLYKTLFVKEVKEEVPGFKTIVFEYGHGISYKAGQYLTFSHYINNEEVRRSYSITSSPALNEPLSIGVKRVDNGLVSRYLADHLQPGSALTTTGPGGFFTLPEDPSAYEKVIFFAAGSGITPVYSLIKTILAEYPLLKVVLVYSTASAAKTIFFQQLEAMRAEFENRFSIEYFFSNNPRLAEARLHRDTIFRLLRDHFKENFAGALFYICGPESYMRLCRFTLLEAGVSKDALRMENFISPPVQKIKVDPPDKRSHHIQINSGDKKHSFEQHYPETILAAANRNKINLPYSCETGKCGNCAARCVSGEVWHSNNEVLTDKELEKGLILTCVGYPVGEEDLLLEM